MVSPEKLRAVKEVREQMDSYAVIGVLNMHHLPARQLYEIRNKLRSQAVIRMVKKRLIMRIFNESERMAPLSRYIEGEPALLMSNTNPFELARVIQHAASKATARAGDIAPEDIMIKAGPTPLPPGPAIGEFQRLKIPAGVEGNKIAVKKDTVVVKKGEAITKPVADILAKLGIEPMEIGLNLVAVLDSGTVYQKDILFIPQEEYVRRLQSAYACALNLSVHIGYYTPQNIGIFLSRSHREAVVLATATGFITRETVGPVLAKARGAMEAVKAKLVREPAHQKEESRTSDDAAPDSGKKE